MIISIIIWVITEEINALVIRKIKRVSQMLTGKIQNQVALGCSMLL